MSRFKKLLSVLVPAMVATGASGSVLVPESMQGFDQARAAGTHEALTRFLIENPDAPEAGVAREVLMRGIAIDSADESLRLAVVAECSIGEVACVV